MAIVITPESELGKELAKWNKPYVYSEYPRMLYMARRRPDGVVSVLEVDDKVFGGNPGTAEKFNATCQLIVKNDEELRNAMDRGWRMSMQEALERHEAKEKAIAEAAAVRAHEDQKMSEAAKAEAAAAEAATIEHVAEVPEKKRGRPRKTA